eukprot:m.1664057 g.1664057  ORF g.1664057 m.1664057 type:complete len:74 (+) comp138173_c0_seq1:56-277(+)
METVCKPTHSFDQYHHLFYAREQLAQETMTVESKKRYIGASVTIDTTIMPAPVGRCVSAWQQKNDRAQKERAG